MSPSSAPNRRRSRNRTAQTPFLVLFFTASATLFLLVISSGAAWAATYSPPLDAPVDDTFRMPLSPYGAGNRGWDYSVLEDTAMRVVADGKVIFAGQVGGVLNVVVQHDDGILSTYSGLKSIAVRLGDRLVSGAPIGTTWKHVFFSARCDGEYIDPSRLFKGRIYLVTLDGRGPGSLDSKKQKANSTEPDAPVPACKKDPVKHLVTADELDWMKSADAAKSADVSRSVDLQASSRGRLIQTKPFEPAPIAEGAGGSSIPRILVESGGAASVATATEAGVGVGLGAEAGAMTIGAATGVGLVVVAGIAAGAGGLWAWKHWAKGH